MSGRSGSGKIHGKTAGVESGKISAWEGGARRLAEQGRLIWLLGETLSAALAARTGGWVPPDEASAACFLQGLVERAYDLPVHAGLDLVADPSRKRVIAAPASAQAATGVGGRRTSASRPPGNLSQEALTDVRCPVLWIGSHDVRGAWVTMALGAGVDGFKRVLALHSGSARDASVAGGLLEDLVARGMRPEGGQLVVTEGSRTLDQAIEGAWGKEVWVAHCRRRLSEEVQAHVPPERRGPVSQELDGAWSLPVEAAGACLRGLAERLEAESPGAAERLARSLEPCLVVDRLGMVSPLKERLESAGTLRMAFEKSLRWGGSPEVGLWAVAAGIPVWLGRTRRLMGWRGLAFLDHSLRLAVTTPGASSRRE